MKYYEDGIRHITKFEDHILLEKENKMNPEIKELNRIICKGCDEKDYERCRTCKIYQLINKIAAQ